MSVCANLPFARGNHSLGRPRVLCWLESLCQALPGGLATSCVRDTQGPPMLFALAGAPPRGSTGQPSPETHPCLRSPE